MENTNIDYDTHWAFRIAQKVIDEFPNKESYTIASGITPSGTIHIGNFREIITVELVSRALKKLGKEVRFIYSWDDYDVYRKVPKNYPKQDLLKSYLRKPIVDVPDVFETQENYARHNEVEVEEDLPIVGVKPIFIYQNQMYKQSKYAQGMKIALENTEQIKEILNEYRKEDLEEDWLPTSIFCNKCGKDSIIHQEYKGGYKLYYECECSHKEELDLRNAGNVKLKWRIDWPMRWVYEDVCFEPGGKDHSTVGGSRDTGEKIINKIWNKKAPIYLMYDFISVKGAGGKMSSSSGNVITLKDLYEVYSPEIVRWFFAGTRPNTEFSIPFDMDILKIYEEFDKNERIYFNEYLEGLNDKEINKQKTIYELSMVKDVPKKRPLQIAFKHLVNLIQINELNNEKVIEYFKDEIKDSFDENRLRNRINCAKNWINKYAPDDLKFSVQKELREEKITELKEKIDENLSNILKEVLVKLRETNNDQELHQFFYDKCKEHNYQMKEFFKFCYNVILDREKGPRLAKFMIDLGYDRIEKLFSPLL